MRLQELHVWQNQDGRVKRVEFHDGPQRMQVFAQKVVRTDSADSPASHVDLTLVVKAIYHLEGESV